MDDKATTKMRKWYRRHDSNIVRAIGEGVYELPLEDQPSAAMEHIGIAMAEISNRTDQVAHRMTRRGMIALKMSERDLLTLMIAAYSTITSIRNDQWTVIKFDKRRANRAIDKICDAIGYLPIDEWEKEDV